MPNADDAASSVVLSVLCCDIPQGKRAPGENRQPTTASAGGDHGHRTGRTHLRSSAARLARYRQGAASILRAQSRRDVPISIYCFGVFFLVADGVVTMAKPMLPNGYLGMQPKFQEFQLTTISHASPEITTDSNHIQIKIGTAKPMKVTSTLIQCGSETQYRELVFTQTMGDTVCLEVLLPSAGYFKLQIYALPTSDTSKTLPGVYNYLVHALHDPSEKIFPFPKQFAQWKEGCYLECPFSLLGNVDLSNVKFRARIPGAKAVAVTVAGNWSQLEQQPDSYWEATIDISSAKAGTAPACLNANFGDDSTKFATLLEYPLSEAKEDGSAQ